ncbi:hypothetical protein D9623_33840 (plasmid) [Azospirillum brasilense]|uniref:PARP-type domain-containing protein n=1 Tax=Azospirillum brasilense TaxID=192 RepID=Q6QW38_AZOBR|nr:MULTISPECIES: hypothetical protein [Azospirillum]YP_001686935.1 hypothetical protein APCd_gp94 [Azospirillum phage Cd]AAS83027.1 hypothetical protein pRhico065 [Azospirillum brasilense]MDW7555424.1 hypothetical protein [Azospirillum brasilense]MDW7595168.1 hypothetical protein [Azospirillum brasilense]MDW7630321.1 hypothetical protein [Azospirillum brasilense]MDX5949689.1 hypothetical protein [Azospirillum brasilense]
MTRLSSKTPTARKSHICDGCNTEIAAGTVYAEYRGVYEGSEYVRRHHVECRDAEAELNSINDLDGEDWMTIAEHYEEAGDELLADLPPIVADRLRLWVKRSEDRSAARLAAARAALSAATGTGEA